MDNIDTSITLSICDAASPDVSRSVVPLFKFAYWYLLGMAFYSGGTGFGLNTPLGTVVSVVLQMIIGIILWFILRIAQWVRPDMISGGNCPQALVFYDTLNRWGAPDPIFIPIFTYTVFIIYMNHRNYRRSFNWILIPVLVAGFVYHLIAEFVLGRVFWYQYLTNLAITILLSGAIIYLVDAFYQSDEREHFDIMAAIYWDVLTPHQKRRFRLYTDNYYNLATRKHTKHKKKRLKDREAQAKFSRWQQNYYYEAIRHISGPDEELRFITEHN